MVANNRTFYATQALLLKPQHTAENGVVTPSANWLSPKGIQSVGISTTFNLSQVFQMGQMELYDRPEETPEIQVTINKIIDGTAPLYLLCMGGHENLTTNQNKPLVQIANNRVNVRLGIFSDKNGAATGAVRSYVDMSGMYLSAFTYTFSTDASLTEEVTLVGNSKVWNSGILGGAPATTQASFGFTGSGEAPNTMMRANVVMSGSVLPSGAGGIPLPSGSSPQLGAHVQNLTISSTLGRDALRELGRHNPYYRYVNFPLEITSEFTVISADGDNIQANDFNAGNLDCSTGQVNQISDSLGGTAPVTGYRNTLNKEIKILLQGRACTDVLQFDLGKKNKLTSVNYSGADTGGGNATVTYSFSTFNTFILSASGTFTESKWVNLADDADFD